VSQVFAVLLDALSKERARQQEEERDEGQLAEGIAASLAEAEAAAASAGTLI
jgi:hypothetical protein